VPVTEQRYATLVVAPGRGTYNKSELGHLKRFHADKPDLLATVDRLRTNRGQPTVSELDGADRYSLGTYSRGDIASPLIFTCSYADFLAIDRDRHDVVAVTGNSMGWYTALACGGAVDLERGFSIVDGMGEITGLAEPGGQVLLTLVDENWQPVPGLREKVIALIAAIGARSDHSLHVSIELGGMLILAGNEAGLKALLAEVPDTPGREPMRLAGHGPFHSPLMRPSSAEAMKAFSPAAFENPSAPMIDGRGHIWRPHASAPEALRDYTFTTQILETYDFTRAIQVAVREFAPDRIVLLGPGDTMGGAVAQALIAIGWWGLGSKADFQAMQTDEPRLIAMGREEQRALAVANAGSRKREAAGR
jgi:malonyl CoA-acyl carrier protein transacylase